MEPWVSTWLSSVASDKLGRFPRTPDSTDCHQQLPALLVPEASGSPGSGNSHVKGKDGSRAKDMWFTVNPGITFRFCQLFAQGITKLSFLSGKDASLLWYLWDLSELTC